MKSNFLSSPSLYFSFLFLSKSISLYYVSNLDQKLLSLWFVDEFLVIPVLILKKIIVTIKNTNLECICILPLRHSGHSCLGGMHWVGFTFGQDTFALANPGGGGGGASGGSTAPPPPPPPPPPLEK